MLRTALSDGGARGGVQAMVVNPNGRQGRSDRRILFLNNTGNPDAVPPVFRSMASGAAEIDAYWCARGEAPEALDGYAGCLISGSPASAYDRDDWILLQHDLIADLAERGTPILGICFGSQIAASALFGRDWVFRRDDCEVGFKSLEVAPEARPDPVCGGLEPSTRMFVWHNDEVRAGHSRMQVLASTDVCPNQIWRHGSLPVWGVQGHLEITVAEAPAWFGRNRRRLEADGADVDRLIDEAEEAEAAKSILRRFLDFCCNDDGVALEQRSGAARPATA